MEIETFLSLNLEIKKVEISMKKPKNYPIKSFAEVKKITTHIFQKERWIGNFMHHLGSSRDFSWRSRLF